MNLNRTYVMEHFSIDIDTIPLRMSDVDVARIFNISTSRLRKWRCGIGSGGPPFHKEGRKVVYLRHEVLIWHISKQSKSVL